MAAFYVQVYERDTWKNTFNLEKDGHSEVYVLVLLDNLS